MLEVAEQPQCCESRSSQNESGWYCGWMFQWGKKIWKQKSQLVQFKGSSPSILKSSPVQSWHWWGLWMRATESLSPRFKMTDFEQKPLLLRRYADSTSQARTPRVGHSWPKSNPCLMCIKTHQADLYTTSVIVWPKGPRVQYAGEFCLSFGRNAWIQCVA